jgi:all-trans-8'-apo-beta-carotenal 15,15'-oxygenase
MLIERRALDYDRSPDFPAIDARRSGQPYDDFWMLGIAEAGTAGRKFFNELVHGSWRDGDVRDICTLGPGEYFGGEPVFAANPANPDEAVILVQRLNARTDEAAIEVFDAFAVARGPLARVPLRHRLHPGFHATFAPAVPLG